MIGDTFHLKDRPTPAFIEVTVPKPMVFAGFYPLHSKDQNGLRSAIEKIALNDSSVSIGKESSMALGNGFRIGFLGLLHMEVRV